MSVIWYFTEVHVLYPWFLLSFTRTVFYCASILPLYLPINNKAWHTTNLTKTKHQHCSPANKSFEFCVFNTHTHTGQTYLCVFVREHLPLLLLKVWVCTQSPLWDPKKLIKHLGMIISQYSHFPSFLPTDDRHCVAFVRRRNTRTQSNCEAA